MKKVTIAATVPGKADEGTVDRSASLIVDYPDWETDANAALEEAKAAYGAAAILSNAFANWRITLQGNIRAGIKKDETQQQIQARLGSSKMGVAATGVQIDPQQAFLALFQSSTPEKQEELLAQLRAKAATPTAPEAGKAPAQTAKK